GCDGFFSRLLEQIFIQPRHQCVFVQCGVSQPQLVKDKSEQLGETKMSVKNKGRVDCGLHAVHEPSEQRRLAGSRLAGNDDKALAGLDTVTQGGKSFPIVRINIRKSRIGSDAKGQLCKSKMFTVHSGRETSRVNAGVARTICPVVAGWFSSLRRHRLWAREKAVDCLENLCQTVGKTLPRSMNDQP